MALISIVFFFSIPRLRDEMRFNPTQKTSRWLLSNVRSLKERSYREKKDYVLHVDTEAHALWVSERMIDADSPEPQPESQDRGGGKYNLPEKIRILNVEFPGNVEVSTGVAEIIFFAKGYSETAFIHMEDDDNRRVSYLIEPFLPEVRYYEAYVGFEQ